MDCRQDHEAACPHRQAPAGRFCRDGRLYVPVLFSVRLHLVSAGCSFFGKSGDGLALLSEPGMETISRAVDFNVSFHIPFGRNYGMGVYETGPGREFLALSCQCAVVSYAGSKSGRFFLQAKGDGL